MAPRYPSSLDLLSTSSSSYAAPSRPLCEDYLSDSSLEFKPTLNLWSSQSWTEQLDKASSSSGKTQRPTKKRVRFNACLTQTQTHTPLSDFSDAEKEACWFTRNEFREMRQQRQQTIDSSAVNLEEEWGLEFANHHSIYYEIRQAINSVLEEQDDQLRWDGYINADVLSARYQAYTLASKDRAQWIGEHYAKEASILL